MLSYKPPFLEAGNLTIFSDDVNDDVFYYICLQPSITSENGAPKLEAYAILPESGTTTEQESVLEASLMMEIALTTSEADLQLAEKAIKDMTGKKPRVLTHAPIHSGKVYMIVAPAGEEPDPEKWFVTSEVKPTIFGDNAAALVARAEGKDAKLLVAALDSDVIAASVHYELEMLGIAPVFKATMKVDWKKVYHHFEEFDKKNFIFYTDEISTTVDKLKETSAIEIEIQELDPDIKAEALKNLMNELKTEVFKKLFQPAASPLSAANKLEDRIANGVSRVLSSIAPGVHHIRRNIDESQLNTITVNLSQKNVKTYPFYPQALLTSMIKKAGGISDKINWIKLDEIPFINQKVEVCLAADTFKSSNIKSVMIDCRVVDTSDNRTVNERSFLFQSDQELLLFFNFIRQKDRAYKYEYKASIFTDTESTRLPDKLELEWQSVTIPYIYLSAAEYFESKEITIALDDSSIFDNTHLIEAQLTVSDQADKAPILKRTFLFNSSDSQQKQLAIIAGKSVAIQFDLQLTYFLSQSKEHKASYENIQNGFFFIPNPFENKWTVDLFANADWQATQKLILETRIIDAERDNLIQNKFDFNKDLNSAKFAASVSLDTPKELFEYRVTCLKTDASIIQGPWLQHEGPILVISDKIQSERIVRATLTKAPDFEEKEIKQVTVEFIYEDTVNNIRVESGRLEFPAVGSTVEFRHPMPDFSHKKYTYLQRVRGRNGSSYKSEWITTDKEKINIEIPDNIW